MVTRSRTLVTSTDCLVRINALDFPLVYNYETKSIAVSNNLLDQRYEFLRNTSLIPLLFDKEVCKKRECRLCGF